MTDNATKPTLEQQPCPTCGCVLYQEVGPCAGSDAIRRHEELVRAVGEFVKARDEYRRVCIEPKEMASPRIIVELSATVELAESLLVAAYNKESP